MIRPKIYPNSLLHLKIYKREINDTYRTMLDEYIDLEGGINEEN